MSEKHDAFVRLAGKRVEAVTETMRIFSNLSGPSYEWTTQEVLAHAAVIESALAMALDRFRENKRWDASFDSTTSTDEKSGPAGSTTIPTESGSGPTELSSSPFVTTDETTEDDPYFVKKERRRARTIYEIIAQAKGDPEPVAALVALQREVIEDLQGKLDRCRANGSSSTPAVTEAKSAPLKSATGSNTRSETTIEPPDGPSATRSRLQNTPENLPESGD